MWGEASAAKKAGRTTSQGLVHSYIHEGGKIGVLIEVACETDFVARNADFQGLVHDLAMHVAAAAPESVSRDEMPADVMEREKKFFTEQAQESGKPENVVEKMVEGRMNKFFAESVLLEQEFVKDPDVKVGDLIQNKIATIGENIQVRRFTRYQLGDDA